jgi:hypothetical protein
VWSVRPGGGPAAKSGSTTLPNLGSLAAKHEFMVVSDLGEITGIAARWL